MGRFLLAIATVGLSLAIGASLANAAGKGSGNSSGPEGLAVGNPNLTTGTTAPSPSSSDTSLGSMLTTTPTIQPSGSDDKVNVRGTILRLPF